MKQCSLVTSLILAILCSAPARGDEAIPLPDSPAGHQTKELLQALANGKREQIQAFISQNFAPSFLDAIPLDSHVDINYRFAGETGGVIPRKVVSSSNTSIMLIADAKKGSNSFMISVEVESARPHKIVRLAFRAPDPGPEVAVPLKPEGDLEPRQVAEWAERAVDELAKADAFSGAVLIAKNDEVFFSKAAGLASRAWNQPNRLNTKFNLGSMNKMFTSVAIAQLVEKGAVSLDDPVIKHLPDYANREVAEQVTVRHLLTHTSGLADYFNEKFMNSSRTLYRSVNDFFPLFAHEPLQFEPGRRFRYSNAGFMVLGAIVQSASGMDYFDYVREHIYKPAGMENTDAYELDMDVPNLAVGYTRGRGPGAAQSASWRTNTFMHVIKGGPAGGGYSTVEDLHRFAIALRNGTLIRPETLELWSTPSPNNQTYAFGFQVFQDGDPRVIGHRGGFPGINSALVVDLSNGHVIAVMANMDGHAVQLLLDSFRDLLQRTKS